MIQLQLMHNLKAKKCKKPKRKQMENEESEILISCRQIDLFVLFFCGENRISWEGGYNKGPSGNQSLAMTRKS